MRDYKRATKASLLRRLRQYGLYVGCSCFGRQLLAKCRGQAYCARADYKRAVAALATLAVKR